MELLKRDRVDIQAASQRLVGALHEFGYITEMDKYELLYRIRTGDATAYGDLKRLLVEMAKEIGRL